MQMCEPLEEILIQTFIISDIIQIGHCRQRLCQSWAGMNRDSLATIDPNILDLQTHFFSKKTLIDLEL